MGLEHLLFLQPLVLMMQSPSLSQLPLTNSLRKCKLLRAQFLPASPTEDVGFKIISFSHMSIVHLVVETLSTPATTLDARQREPHRTHTSTKLQHSSQDCSQLQRPQTASAPLFFTSRSQLPSKAHSLLLRARRSTDQAKLAHRCSRSDRGAGSPSGSSSKRNILSRTARSWWW